MTREERSPRSPLVLSSLAAKRESKRARRSEAFLFSASSTEQAQNSSNHPSPPILSFFLQDNKLSQLLSPPLGTMVDGTSDLRQARLEALASTGPPRSQKTLDNGRPGRAAAAVRSLDPLCALSRAALSSDEHYDFTSVASDNVSSLWNRGGIQEIARVCSTRGRSFEHLSGPRRLDRFFQSPYLLSANASMTRARSLSAHLPADVSRYARELCTRGIKGTKLDAVDEFDSVSLLLARGKKKKRNRNCVSELFPLSSLTPSSPSPPPSLSFRPLSPSNHPNNEQANSPSPSPREAAPPPARAPAAPSSSRAAAARAAAASRASPRATALPEATRPTAGPRPPTAGPEEAAAASAPAEEAVGTTARPEVRSSASSFVFFFSPPSSNERKDSGNPRLSPPSSPLPKNKTPERLRTPRRPVRPPRRPRRRRRRPARWPGPGPARRRRRRRVWRVLVRPARGPRRRRRRR